SSRGGSRQRQPTRSYLRIGMKSMGDPYILDSKTVTPTECLNYALSLPTSTVVTGIEKMEILEQAFTIAKNFKPMTQAAMTGILAKIKSAAMTGKFERIKTDNRFDGTAKNPKWLGGMQEGM
ncbi:MAG: hypothetical protein WKF90_11780, partial [Pyrinomonadaceae bacterium]